MVNVNQLRQDVRWWEEEVRSRQNKATKAADDLRIEQQRVAEAIKTLSERQHELMQAEQEEARAASTKRAA